MKKLTIALLLSGFLFVSCEKDDYESPFSGNDNRIISLTIRTADGVSYPAVISDSEIVLTVPDDVSLENASVAYALSENTTVQPKLETISDWSQSYRFLATSYSQQDRIYTYRVKYVDGENRESVVLKTQSDVTEFGRSGKTFVSGNLVIGSQNGDGEQISNINALRGVTTVKGSVIIYDTYIGENLDGLSGLESAGGIILGENAVNCLDTTVKNPEFTGVTHSGVRNIYLASLRRVTGNIRIHGEHIQDVHFPCLEYVGLDLQLMSNDLQYLNMPSLKTVGGMLKLCGSLENVNGWEIVNDNTAVSLTQTSLNHISLEQLERTGSFILCYFHKVEKIAVPDLKDAGYVRLVSSAFSDYTDFATVVAALNEHNWVVSDCSYNPTWQDMQDKKYTKE